MIWFQTNYKKHKIFDPFYCMFNHTIDQFSNKYIFSNSNVKSAEMKLELVKRIILHFLRIKQLPIYRLNFGIIFIWLIITNHLFTLKKLLSKQLKVFKSMSKSFQFLNSDILQVLLPDNLTDVLDISSQLAFGQLHVS